MKKILSLLFVIIILLGITSCRKMPNGVDSSYMSVIEEKEYITESIDETEQEPQSKSVETIYKSTIGAPDSVYFYKDGKYGISTDKNLTLEIARQIESWYANYESQTIPFTNLAVDEQFITDTKCNEAVIELYFDYNNKINFLGKIDLADNIHRLLIPLTGEYAYYIFSGISSGKYQSGPYNLNGSGLEKYFDGITLDQKAQDWQSTVIAPFTVTFYKDGMQSISTDKELNHKIARHIEEWFKYEESIAMASLAAKTDRINYNKLNEMAIELQFDGEIKFYGGIINPNTRTLFIPLTGDDDHMIFHNSIDTPDDWSGPFAGGSGLEQYFDYAKFTPLTEE